MYSEAEAARLLRVPQGTLNYWLEGGRRGSKTYKPVIRPESKGNRAQLTWAEFIEAGLLRSYRRDLNVGMAELRTFIDTLRNRFGVPYPLAEPPLDPEFWLVADARGQYLLLPPSKDFFERVTWDGDVAAGWRPHDDPASPVRMSPDQRFGRPSVGGISTEVL